MERADKIRRQVGRCMEELLQGTLTEAGLREILDTLDEGPPRQQLLFLRVDGSTISAGVIGMMMLEDGQVTEGPQDPREWPYGSVIDAIQDGWRVIKFPELALWIDERQTYEVGAEFVLEKRSES